MNIFVDENIPSMTVRELIKLGHNIIDIRGSDKKGMIDDDIWKFCQEEKRLLITTDKGFAQKRHENHYGILIIRLKQPNKLKIHQKVMQAINRFKEEKWNGLTVIMQDLFHTISISKK